MDDISTLVPVIKIYLWLYIVLLLIVILIFLYSGYAFTKYSPLYAAYLMESNGHSRAGGVMPQ